MSVPNGEKLATKQDLADMYQGILPYLGGMPEMVANKFSKGDLYSTDEKMIGQWIDGKPLYQKVFPTNVTMGSSYTIMISDTTEYNIAGIVKCYGIRYYPVGTTTMQSVPMLAYIDINASAKPVYCYMYGAAAQFNYIILQYTKTTDSAISIGDDTDYSTEEKIIGTWIDGRPLWQKTIDCGVLPNATSSKLIAHGISNFYMPVQVFGVAHRTNGASILLPCVRAKGVTTSTDVAVSQFVSIDIDATNIAITTGYDWSAITDKSYVTLQYIKTT